jgi:4-aminobutyrate aminotransferase-like enzyme
VCAAAAAANIDVLIEEDLIGNAARVGAVLQDELGSLTREFPAVAPVCHGAGLVSGLQIVKRGKKEPDPDTAWEVVNRCFRSGVLMFAPVGYAGQTVKVAPPLCITADAVREGVGVIRESLRAVAG